MKQSLEKIWEKLKIFEAIAEQISNGILERFLKESLPEKNLGGFPRGIYEK